MNPTGSIHTVTTWLSTDSGGKVSLSLPPKPGPPPLGPLSPGPPGPPYGLSSDPFLSSPLHYLAS